MEENEKQSGAGSFIAVCVLAAAFVGYVLFDNGMLESRENSSSDADDPVKVIHESEWKAMQSELVMLQSELEDIKDNKTKVISLRKFAQKHDGTEATVTLRNNTPKTITHIEGHIFYCTMTDGIIDYKKFSTDIKIEPGMAKSFEWEGCKLKDGLFYYANAPSNTDSRKLYKVKLKVRKYKTK